uniref:Pre-mRNA-splicing factor 38 n=1 Tax=Panagrolaimus superbus TaxID=310955 RepID=A0A914Z4S6_9BILA
MDASNFREMMGFSNGNDVMYEDDATDSSIPDIQKITKRNNILPIHGSQTTMNLNPLVLENIVQSTYYKNFLSEVTTFQQIVDEVYYNVSHLEPWERGTRRMQGVSGMCGGVRGVGAGGVISTAFCLLYKLFTLRLTRKQLVSMVNSTQSVYLRGMGFIYARYTQPPADLWSWLSPYLDDDEEIDPRSGGGDMMTIGQFSRTLFQKLDWYGTLFPRIPIPIQKDIDQKLRDYGRSYQNDREMNNTWTNDNERDHREDSRKRYREESDKRSQEPDKVEHRPTRCGHHRRHHHCIKHRNKCPTKAKKARLEKAADETEKNEQTV